MLWKKLWRTMGLYKAQFISMIIMIALGVGIFIGFNMEWVSIEKNVDAFLEETGFADYRIISEKGFSEEELARITALQGIEQASRYVSVNTDVKGTDGDSLTLTVTENWQVSSFLTVSGADYDAESLNGIWLSDKYAQANGVAVGDALTLVYGMSNWKAGLSDSSNRPNI